MKSLRDISGSQESARINAFYVIDSETTLRFRYIPLRFTPDRGFCMAVCDRKVINKNLYLQKIFSERWECTLVANRTFVIFGGLPPAAVATVAATHTSRKLPHYSQYFVDRGSSQMGPADRAQIFFLICRAFYADRYHGLLRDGLIARGLPSKIIPVVCIR